MGTHWKNAILTCLLAAALLIGGLVSSQEEPPPTPHNPSIPTRIPTNTPTMTFTPSPTLTPSITPSPTNTPTPTTTPTATEVPIEVQIEQLMEQADEQADIGNYDEALALYEEAIALDPSNPEPYADRGYVYWDMGELEDAEQSFSAAIQRGERAPHIYLARADVRLELGQLDPALSDINRVIAEEPENVEALLIKARISQQLRLYEDALDSYSQVIELAPDSINAWLERGLLQADLGNIEAAIADLDEYITRAGDEAAPDVVAFFEELTSTPVEGEFIAYGEVITGSIDDDEATTYYTFNAHEGDVLVIEMRRLNGNLDPLLVLLDEHGNEIIRNDDDPEGNGRDAAIREFVIPEDGHYTIMATRFRGEDGTTSGEFELGLHLIDGVVEVTPPSPPEEGLLAYGDEIQSFIDNQQSEVRFDFNGARGDIISIQMQRLSGDLDPLVILLDETGHEIARNDDDPQGSGRDAFLREFELPHDGVYTILATRFGQAAGGTSGEFILRLLATDGQSIQTANTNLQYGERVEGAISDVEPIISYTFAGHAGDVVDIGMQSITGTLDPLLVLLSPTGEEIALNDDDPEGSGRDAFLRNIQLPSNGIYTILATRFRREAGTTTGTFELQLDKVGEVSGDAPVIAYGHSVEGQISNGSPVAIYHFEAEAGDVISITMERLNGNLDAFIILQDSDGNELARNDDGTGLTSPTDAYLQAYTIPATGEYTILATRYQQENGTTEGAFRLQLFLEEE